MNGNHTSVELKFTSYNRDARPTKCNHRIGFQTAQYTTHAGKRAHAPAVELDGALEVEHGALVLALEGVVVAHHTAALWAKFLHLAQGGRVET
jgi:hypothetical protein